MANAISNATIDEAKQKCSDDGFWGFTFAGPTDTIKFEGNIELQGVGDRLRVAYLPPWSLPSYSSGTTYVHLTSAGREVICEAIRKVKDRKAKASIVESVDDLHIILPLVQEEAFLFKCICPELRCNIQIAEAAVRSNPFVLRYAPDSVKADRTIVQIAVEIDGFALQYASTALRGDRAIVLLAVLSEPKSLRYASNDLLADRDVCLLALRRNGDMLRFVDPELQNDRDIVITAVQKDGEALMWASDAMQCDPEVVAFAVQRSPKAADHALF